MAELALTAERREELAELLNDEQRLRTEHPKVAEYLETAPMLSGTGDDHADATFDLRFLHYATGGASETGNPYWDIVEPAVHVDRDRRVVNGGSQTGSSRLGYAQTILQSIYAYAIPAPETVRWCREFCEGRQVVELGAGRGYWAAQLSRAGLSVAAYDSEPPDQRENVSFTGAAGEVDTWHEVGDLQAFTARGGPGAHSVLFLCWPPGWGNTMASEALAAFEKAGGQRLVFIGEPKGGKTGDDAFFEALAASWNLESQDPNYVAWWNLADEAQGWVRR